MSNKTVILAYSGYFLGCLQPYLIKAKKIKDAKYN